MIAKSVSLDHIHPNGAEIQKPEAEGGVFTEIEYIESHDLNTVTDVDAALKTLLTGLDSKDWVSTCDALNSVRRLSIFHKGEMLPLLEKVIPLVVKSLKNPRSALSKTACMTSADIFSSYNDHIIDQLDPLLTQLLLKSSQDKRFVCEAAEKALVAMTTHVSPTLLLPCLKNRNPRIRCAFPQVFSEWALKALENMDLRNWSKQPRLSLVTNSQNPERLHGRSYSNFRQFTINLILWNPRRRNIQRLPLGKFSANQISRRLVHRPCFVPPMSLVRLERVLLRVHDTNPEFVSRMFYETAVYFISGLLGFFCSSVRVYMCH